MKAEAMNARSHNAIDFSRKEPVILQISTPPGRANQSDAGFAIPEQNGVCCTKGKSWHVSTVAAPPLIASEPGGTLLRFKFFSANPMINPML